MRLLVATLGAVVLAACSTPDELRRRAPNVTFTTDNTPAQTVECIANRWENEAFGYTPQVIVRATPTGFTASIPNLATGFVTVLADVSATGGGSTVKLYTQGIPPVPGWDELALKCRTP